MSGRESKGPEVGSMATSYKHDDIPQSSWIQLPEHHENQEVPQEFAEVPWILLQETQQAYRQRHRDAVTVQFLICVNRTILRAGRDMLWAWHLESHLRQLLE